MPFNIVDVLFRLLPFPHLPGCLIFADLVPSFMPCIPRRVALNIHFIQSIIWWIHTNSEKWESDKPRAYVYVWIYDGATVKRRRHIFTKKHQIIWSSLHKPFLFIYFHFFRVPLLPASLCYFVAATVFSHCNASISRYISICVLLFFFVVLGSSLFSIFFGRPSSSDFLLGFCACARTLCALHSFIHYVQMFMIMCVRMTFGILPLYLNIMPANQRTDQKRININYTTKLNHRTIVYGVQYNDSPDLKAYRWARNSL